MITKQCKPEHEKKKTINLFRVINQVWLEKKAKFGHSVLRRATARDFS